MSFYDTPFLNSLSGTASLDYLFVLSVVTHFAQLNLLHLVRLTLFWHRPAVACVLVGNDYSRIEQRFSDNILYARRQRLRQTHEVCSIMVLSLGEIVDASELQGTLSFGENSQELTWSNGSL